MSKLHVRTVILSDIHLGTPHSKAAEVTHFLKHVRCDRLILNGDIIDGWRLRRGDPWTKAHTRFVRRVLTMIQKRDTEVVYLRGNHDDFLGRLLPMQFEHLSLVEDHILETSRGRYLVLHGDVFDGVVKNMVFLAHLGDMGYAFLLRLNRVKQAVSFIGKFEDQVAALAKDRGCVGVICGHIHTPADKMIGDIHYLNSGDWVESLTGIVEHHDGRFELITYKDFAARYAPPPAGDHDENDEALPFPGPATGLLEAGLPVPRGMAHATANLRD
jgi:UDP-2,3-diacylglucosamine pyrophosphatase LpxH